MGFGFLLSANSTIRIENINGLQASTSLNYADKVAVVYANKSSYGHQEFKANQTLQSFYIHFSYTSFLDILGSANEDLPHSLFKTLTTMEGSYIVVHPMNQEMIATCYQLQHNSYKGKSKEFFLESKVFELIAYQIDSLIHSQGLPPAKVRPLTAQEEERIDQCYQLIQNNLKSPPSFIKLAKETGLSVYRLKTGLWLRYGNTPFKLLTEMRMQKAKEMLLRGESSISNIAREVGYSSFGSFSNTFFERFGVRPSAYKK